MRRVQVSNAYDFLRAHITKVNGDRGWNTRLDPHDPVLESISAADAPELFDPANRDNILQSPSELLLLAFLPPMTLDTVQSDGKAVRRATGLELRYLTNLGRAIFHSERLPPKPDH